ncbi:MAG: hypothetical protein ACPIOQ_15385 [Promethearchaeia archaeon]
MLHLDTFGVAPRLPQAGREASYWTNSRGKGWIDVNQESEYTQLTKLKMVSDFSRQTSV